MTIDFEERASRLADMAAKEVTVVDLGGFHGYKVVMSPKVQQRISAQLREVFEAGKKAALAAKEASNGNA